MRVLAVLMVLGWGVVPVCGAEGKGCTITGKLSGPEQKEVRIADAQVALGTGGAFRHTVEIDRPAFITLTWGRAIELYLVPGKTLQLTADGSGKPQGLSFSGDLEPINRCWAAVSADLEMLKDRLTKEGQRVYTSDGDAFLAEIGRRFAPLRARLEQLAATAEPERSFVEDGRQRLDLARANLLLDYPDAVRYFTHDASFRPPEGFTDFVGRLPLTDARWLHTEDFRVFIDRWVTFSATERPPRAEEPKRRYLPALWTQLQIILALVKDPAIRDFLLQKRLSQLLDEHYSKYYAELAPEFRRYCRNQAGLDQKIAAARAAEQARETGTVRTVYKTVGDVTLEAFLYLPSGWKKEDRRGTVVFFHGGGWTIGTPHWGEPFCRHFAQQGLVAVSFEFRLMSAHGTTPVESMRDARSALRWLRQHARDYGIDPDRIAASGFSAGAHLAASTAGNDGFDEPGEDATVRSGADALLLWSAPVRFTAESDSWFISQLRGRASFLACSPYDQIQKGHPPTIMFHGAADDLVSPQFARDYAEKMNALGNRCELHLYPGLGHMDWPADRDADVQNKMDAFLASLGFMARPRQ